MKQVVLVRFFGGEQPILVPGSADTMPATVSQRDFLAKQPCSIKVSFDVRSHHTVYLHLTEIESVQTFINHSLAGLNQRSYHDEGIFLKRKRVVFPRHLIPAKIPLT